MHSPRTIVRAAALIRTTIKDMIVEGGAVIETTFDDRPVARTVVQPNGSTIWTLSQIGLRDPGTTQRHLAAVTAWHTQLREALDHASSLLRATAGWIAAIIGLLGAAAPTTPQIRALVAITCFALARAALRVALPRLARWRLRTLLRGALAT